MVSLTWSLTWEGCFFGVSPGKGKFSRGDQKSFLFKHGLQAFAALRAFCGHISARGCASLGLRNFTKNWSVWSSLGGSLTSHESNTIFFNFAQFLQDCARIDDSCITPGAGGGRPCRHMWPGQVSRGAPVRWLASLSRRTKVGRASVAIFPTIGGLLTENRWAPNENKEPTVF
jgi:hypothetical protein